MNLTPEQYATNLIRAALDKGEVPNLRRIADYSALTVREVDQLRDRMLSGKLQQVTTSPTRPAAPEQDRWRTGLNHPSARVRRAAEKAVAAVAAVDALLEQHAAQDGLRKREAKLLAELAKVRAELGHKTAAPTPAVERVPCPDCGDLVTPARINQHAARSAKHRGTAA